MNLFHSPEDDKRISLESADPLFLLIIREMLEAGSSHFQHKTIPHDYPTLPVWASNVYRHLKAIEYGQFGRHFPPDYLSRNLPPWDISRPLPYPEAIRDIMLSGVRKVAQMPESERAWPPRSLDEWLLTKRPHHPATSGLLRAIRKPDALERAESMTDRDAGAIVAIQRELGVQDIEGLQGIYNSSTDQCRELTYWRQVLALSRWLEIHGNALSRQFGAGYRERWGTRKLVGIVELLRLYRRSEGHWSGWFPAPGDKEFGAACDWIAMECGVYLYLVESGKAGKPCSSGVVGGAESVESVEGDPDFGEI